MPVTYAITFDVYPEKVGVFRALLDGVLDAMRSEETFHEAVLHADPACATRFMLYETWADHDDVATVQLARPIAGPGMTRCPACWPGRARSRSGSRCGPIAVSAWWRVHLAILVTNKVDEAVIVASQKQSVSVAGISGRVVCAYLLSREAPMIGARKVEDHD